MNIGNFNSYYLCVNSKTSKIMKRKKKVKKCAAPSDETASLAGKILRNPKSSNKAKKISGAILRLAHQKPKCNSQNCKKGK